MIPQYKIWIENVLIHDSRGTERVTDGILKEVVNKAGSFTFKLPATSSVVPNLGDRVHVDIYQSGLVDSGDTGREWYYTKELYSGRITSIYSKEGFTEITTIGLLSFVNQTFSDTIRAGETTDLDDFLSNVASIGIGNGSTIGSVLGVRGDHNDWNDKISVEIYVPYNSNGTVKVAALQQYLSGVYRTTYKFTQNQFNRSPYYDKYGASYVKNFLGITNPSIGATMPFILFKLTPTVGVTGAKDGDLANLRLAPFTATSLSEVTMQHDAYGDNHTYYGTFGETMKGNYVSTSHALTNAQVTDAMNNRNLGEADFTYPREYKNLEVGKLYFMEMPLWAERQDFEYDQGKTSQEVRDSAITMNYDFDTDKVNYLFDNTVGKYGGCIKIVNEVDYNNENAHKDIPTLRFYDEAKLPRSTQRIKYGTNMLPNTLRIETSGEIYSGVIVEDEIGYPRYDADQSTFPAIAEYEPLRKYNRLKKFRFSESAVTKEDKAKEIYDFLHEVENGATVVRCSAIDRSYADSDSDYYDADEIPYFTIGCTTELELRNGDVYPAYCVGATRYINDPQKDRFEFSTVLDSSKKISNSSSRSGSSSGGSGSSDKSQWQDVTFNSGLTVGNHATDKLRYCKVGNRVYLQGKIQTTSSYASSGGVVRFAVLPAGSRPKLTRYTLCTSAGANMARIGVNAAGTIFLDFIVNATANNHVSGSTWVECSFDFATD